MKTIKIFCALFIINSISAQQVANFTYLDVPTQEIGKFVRLHKEITDMTVKQRISKSLVINSLSGIWVCRYLVKLSIS